MGFFLLGSYFSYFEAVGDISVLGNLVTVDEETCDCYINIYYSLEYISNLIFHGPCPF